MNYNYIKSVGSEKIIRDTEAYYLSMVRSHELEIDPLYARSTFWLAHTQGLSSSQIWNWPKTNDVMQSKGVINPPPHVLQTVTETLMHLNVYNDEIVAMQQQRKPIRIFYSESSAMNKSSYMDDVFELYKSLFFDGIPISFINETMLASSSKKKWDVVLVHANDFLAETECKALQNYLDNDGVVLLDSSSLLKNTYTKALLELEGDGLKYVASVDQYKAEAYKVLQDLGSFPSINVEEVNNKGQKYCTWKCVKNAEGHDIVSIVNLGKDTVSLKISSKDTIKPLKAVNLLTDQIVTMPLEVEKYGMAFLEIIR